MNKGGIDDRILHAEITYWKQGQRDDELWGFEEMLYIPAGKWAQWLLNPSVLEHVWRMVTKKLEREAEMDGAYKVRPISWRTIAVKDIPQ